MQLGAYTTNVDGQAVSAEAPARDAERPGTSLIDGRQRRHGEDDSPDSTAADLIGAGGQVLHAVEIEAAGERHGEPAPGALLGNH